MVFEKNGIGFEWKEIVDNILDLNKTEVCPFEKIAADISEPEESYLTFKALLRKNETVPIIFRREQFISN